MSYCRWSEESAVYVYPTFGGIVCCACSANDGKDFKARHRGMLAHLQMHITERGDKVPAYAIGRLAAEINKRKSAAPK